LRSNPAEHGCELGVFVKPVASAEVGSSKVTNNGIISDVGKLVSKVVVDGSKGIGVVTVGLLALQHLVSMIDPSHGCCGAKVYLVCLESSRACIKDDPLQRSFLLLATCLGRCKRTGIEVSSEDGLRLGTALPEDGVAFFPILFGGWLRSELRDMYLKGTKIVHDLGYPHRARFIETVGHCGVVNVEKRETAAYDLSGGSGNDGLHPGGALGVIK